MDRHQKEATIFGASKLGKIDNHLYKNIVTETADLDLDHDYLAQLDNISAKKATRKVKEVIDSYMSLPDVLYFSDNLVERIYDRAQVPYDSNGKITNVYFNKRLLTNKDLATIASNYKTKVSPFNIPVRTGNSHTCIATSTIVNKEDNSSKVITRKIYLDKDLKLLKMPSYAGEIAEIEMYNYPGMSKEYINTYVPSFLLERLVAENTLNNEEYSIYNNINLQNIKDAALIEYLLVSLNIRHKNYFVYSKLNSFIKAWDYYNSYIENNRDDRYIYNLEDVFNSKMTVEEMLNKHNIDNKEDGKTKIRRLIKSNA